MFSKSFNIFILQFSFSTILYAQNAGARLNYINDFQVNKNSIIALSDGKLFRWERSTLEVSKFELQEKSTLITAFHVDKSDRIVIATSDKQIHYLKNFNKLSKPIYTSKYFIFYIERNSEEELFLLDEKGIIHPKSKKSWNELIEGRYSVVKRFSKPSDFRFPFETFLDRKGKWWIWRCYGEFGSDIQVFNIENKEIHSNYFPKMSKQSICPRSIFEHENGKICVVDALQHFSTSTNIFFVDSLNNAIKIYELNDINKKDTLNEDKYVIQYSYDSTMVDSLLSKGELNLMQEIKVKASYNYDYVTTNPYLGACNYSYFDSCIYCYSNFGFLRFEPDFKNYERMETNDLNLVWSRASSAVGYVPAVKKIIAIGKNQFVFSTSNDGMGIYKDGKIDILEMPDN